MPEFASALSIKVRRGEFNATQARAAWEDFDAFSNSGSRLLPVSGRAFKQAAMLALNAPSGLRAGDSLHLALALEAGASGLSTADDTLENNAKVKGLSVIRF